MPVVEHVDRQRDEPGQPVGRRGLARVRAHRRRERVVVVADGAGTGPREPADRARRPQRGHHRRARPGTFAQHRDRGGLQRCRRGRGGAARGHRRAGRPVRGPGALLAGGPRPARRGRPGRPGRAAGGGACGVGGERRRYAEPETDLERRLAAIWGEVLGRERVGRDDAFFELGGNSLRAAQLVARINGTLPARMAVHQLYDHPTVGRLAEVLDKAR
ncbi:phosphopantetheine-binding protein [Saccharopolyspora spinosporotrichia]